jgi:hypothetical protein
MHVVKLLFHIRTCWACRRRAFAYAAQAPTHSSQRPALACSNIVSAARTAVDWMEGTHLCQVVTEPHLDDLDIHM